MRYYLFVILFILHQHTAYAFYDWHNARSEGNARASIRGFAFASQQPLNPDLYQDRDDEALGEIARLIASIRIGTGWRFELNAYQTWLPTSLVSSGNGVDTVLDVERSGALEWSHSDERYAHLAFDRLSLRKSFANVDISIGRQPINLATTFFFSPNDFFAPFSAQAFYRVFKPGVDGVRADISLNELTQLSFIGVQGYREEAASDSGWSDSSEQSRNSYLTRFATNLAGMEWAVLSGKIRRTRINGGSISGELFDWLGLRAEGHVLELLDKDVDEMTELSIGIEHRWESSLFVQLEQFYHGRGANSVAAYTEAANSDSSYLARRYHALGLSYEFTPLLTGQMTIIRNAIDRSRLFSANALYSLSDESELSIGVTIPDGTAPQGLTMQDEYGSYPRLLNVEVRAYF